MAAGRFGVPAPPFVPPPAPDPRWAPASGPEPAEPPAAAPPFPDAASTAPAGRPAVPERPGGRSTERLLSAAFAVLGTVITLVGVTYLVVLGVRSGVFGPVPRTASLVVLSAVLLAAAARVRARSGTGAAAVSLAGVGLTGLHLALLAATAVYEWLPAVPGLLLAVALALAGLEIAHRWCSQALAVTGITAVCLLVPFVGAAEDVALMSAHVLVLAVGCGRVLLLRPGRVGLTSVVLTCTWLYAAATAVAGGPSGLSVLVPLAAAVAVWAWVAVQVRRTGAHHLVVAVPVFALPVLALVEFGQERGDLFVLGVLLSLAVALATSAFPTGRGARALSAPVRTTFLAVAAAFVLVATLLVAAAPYAVVILLGQALVLDVVTHVSRTRTALFTSLGFGVVALGELLARVEPGRLVSPSALAAGAAWPDVVSAVLRAARGAGGLHGGCPPPRPRGGAALARRVGAGPRHRLVRHGGRGGPRLRAAAHPKRCGGRLPRRAPRHHARPRGAGVLAAGGLPLPQPRRRGARRGTGHHGRGGGQGPGGRQRPRRHRAGRRLPGGGADVAGPRGPLRPAAEHLPGPGARRLRIPAGHGEGAVTRWSPPLRPASAPSGTRTPNPLIKSQLLCQLS